MRLREQQRRLLAHLAAEPGGRLLAFQIAPDPATAEVFLACVYAGTGSPAGAGDPRRQQLLELIRGTDHGGIFALVKGLAAEYGVPLPSTTARASVK